MNRKSIAQEYYILAADKNGMLPPMRIDECNAGLVTAGFMDFILNGIITEEKKKITVVKELPQELSHIASLYTYLSEKPRSIGKLMSDYEMGRRIKELVSEVGESLVEDGLAARGEGGLFGPKITYTPAQDVREELSEILKTALMAEDISPQDVALICILQETKSLQAHLSKEERDAVKARLKALKKDPQNRKLADMVNYISDRTTILVAWMIGSGII